MQNDSQKQLYNERFLWKQNKTYLVHFTFFGSFKRTPNSLQNSKSLMVRALEIIEGGSWLPLTIGIRCGYQASQYARRVNILGNPSKDRQCFNPCSLCVKRAFELR